MPEFYSKSHVSIHSSPLITDLLINVLPDPSELIHGRKNSWTGVTELIICHSGISAQCSPGTAP